MQQFDFASNGDVVDLTEQPAVHDVCAIIFAAAEIALFVVEISARTTPFCAKISYAWYLAVLLKLWLISDLDKGFSCCHFGRLLSQKCLVKYLFLKTFEDRFRF